MAASEHCDPHLHTTAEGRQGIEKRSEMKGRKQGNQGLLEARRKSRNGRDKRTTDAKNLLKWFRAKPLQSIFQCGELGKPNFE
jgi:hypothetical protein